MDYSTGYRCLIDFILHCLEKGLSPGLRRQAALTVLQILLPKRKPMVERTQTDGHTETLSQPKRSTSENNPRNNESGIRLWEWESYFLIFLFLSFRFCRQWWFEVFLSCVFFWNWTDSEQEARAARSLEYQSTKVSDRWNSYYNYSQGRRGYENWDTYFPKIGTHI